MDSRRFSAVGFVVLCLTLSGLVLRRQMAAHPIPPTSPGQEQAGSLPPSFLGQWVDRPGWHAAAPPTRKAVLASIQGQLDAFRDGDAAKATFYQSRRLRDQAASPQAFLAMIRSHYPAFGHYQSVRFGIVVTDKTARFADVIVTVRGLDGRMARGDYEMVLEDGRYRVAGVGGGGPVRE